MTDQLEEAISVSHYAHSPSERKRLRFIISAVVEFARKNGRDVRDLYVLEVACGGGGVTLPVARLGCSVRAFDIDARGIASLTARASELGMSNVTATVDDGYDFADGKVYDVVIASEVFEHVREPGRLAANIRKHMRDGSHLILTIPNGYGPWEMGNRLSFIVQLRRSNFLRRLVGKPQLDKGGGAFHCQFYTRRRLTNLLAQHSFRLVRSGRSTSVLSMIGNFKDNRLVGGIDVRLADVLPYWLASGWYFVFELESGSSQQ